MLTFSNAPLSLIFSQSPDRSPRPQMYDLFLPPAELLAQCPRWYAAWSDFITLANTVSTGARWTRLIRLSCTARPPVPFYRGIQVAQGKMSVLNSVCKVRDISLFCFLADPVFSGWVDRWVVELSAGDTSCRVPGMYFFNVSPSTSDTRDYANRNLHPALTFRATAGCLVHASASCLDFFSNIVFYG